MSTDTTITITASIPTVTTTTWMTTPNTNDIKTSTANTGTKSNNDVLKKNSISQTNGRGTRNGSNSRSRSRSGGAKTSRNPSPGLPPRRSSKIHSETESNPCSSATSPPLPPRRRSSSRRKNSRGKKENRKGSTSNRGSRTKRVKNSASTSLQLPFEESQTIPLIQHPSNSDDQNKIIELQAKLSSLQEIISKIEKEAIRLEATSSLKSTAGSANQIEVICQSVALHLRDIVTQATGIESSKVNSKNDQFVRVSIPEEIGGGFLTLRIGENDTGESIKKQTLEARKKYMNPSMANLESKSFILTDNLKAPLTKNNIPKGEVRRPSLLHLVRVETADPADLGRSLSIEVQKEKIRRKTIPVGWSAGELGQDSTDNTRVVYEMMPTGWNLGEGDIDLSDQFKTPAGVVSLSLAIEKVRSGNISTPPIFYVKSDRLLAFAKITKEDTLKYTVGDFVEVQRSDGSWQKAEVREVSRKDQTYRCQFKSSKQWMIKDISFVEAQQCLRNRETLSATHSRRSDRSRSLFLPKTNIKNVIPDLSGYLTMYDPNHSTWKIRFFSLDRECIVYYTKDTMRDARGCIILINGTVIDKKKDAEFQVKNKKTAYTLRARSIGDKRNWVATIKATINAISLGQQVLADDSKPTNSQSARPRSYSAIHTNTPPDHLRSHSAPSPYDTPISSHTREHTIVTKKANHKKIPHGGRFSNRQLIRASVRSVMADMPKENPSEEKQNELN